MVKSKYQPVLFPQYIEKEFKDKTLAYLDDMHIITTEHANDMHIIRDFSTLLSTTFNHNLLTFTRSIPTFPWLQEVIAMGDRPMCSEQGVPLGIRLRGYKNTSRWIASATAWGMDDFIEKWLETHRGNEKQAIDAWLATMRQAYNLAGVGTSPSPGAWGQAMFRQSFKELYGEEWKEKRHRRPPGSYAEKIRYESSGARSEVFQLNVQFDVAYENDKKNAYGESLGQAQPTGKCHRVKGEAAISYVFYFVECEVTLSTDLILGPFPVRQGAGRNRFPTFPRDAGTYRTWLWNREIELARREGCNVKIIGGFGWSEATFDFQPFVHKISELRDKAPKAVQSLVKLALVAAVGRLGMPEERYVLVADKDRVEGDRAIGDAEIAYDWWIHEEFNSYPQSMPHIFSHVLMLCRLSLYEKTKEMMEQELNVIATNTDAVITEKRPDLPAKGTPVSTGQWTALELHDAIVTANRHLDSREKSVHPGVPKKGRKKQ